MKPPVGPIDKFAARRAFNRAAPRYDHYAVLQQELNRRLLARLDLLRLTPQRILELGCGTGAALPALHERYPTAEIIALDFATAMLRHVRQHSALPSLHLLCADLDALPLAPGSVDLIFSNATLQWSNTLEASLAALHTCLRPGGALLFTTFGVDTLHELRTAWSSVTHGTSAHVSHFFDLHDIGDALIRVGFAEPVLDMEQFTLTYAHVRDLMRDLKGLGAHNALQRRARHLTRRSQLTAVERTYERWRLPDGRLPATWEVIYGLGWRAPDQRPPVTVPLPALSRPPQP